MSSPVRPEPSGSRIERNIAALRSQGASEQDIEAYLTDHEGLKPITAPTMAARDATSALPTPRRTGQSIGQALTGAAEQMNQGATFGLSDEIGAVVGGLIADPRHPLKNFNRLRKEITQPAQQFASEHPALATAANLAGGLEGGLTQGAVAGAVRGAPAVVQSGGKLANLAKLLGSSAAIGAGTAAASAEGSVADRLKAAPAGAAFGAGAVLGLKGAGGIARATGVPQAVQRLLPRASEQSVVGKVVGRTGMATTEDLAKADILKQLQRARVPLSELETRAATAHPDEMLVNIGGDPLVERAGGAYSVPSRGAADIKRAVEAQNQRLPKATREAAEQAIGVPRQNAVQTVDDLLAQRSARDDQTFGALKQHYAAPQKIDGLDALVGRPSFDKAVKEAEAILRETPDGLSAPLLQTVKAGKKTVTVVRPLTFTEAQILKQTHDDVAKMASPLATLESGGVTKTRASKQKGTHAELVDALKAAFPGDEAAGVPSYETALATSADPMKLKDAHELGTQFMRAKTDELQALWPTLSDAEKEFYRKGALASIDDAVRGKTDGLNPVRPFRDDVMRDNLKIILPSEDAHTAFYNAVDKIHGMQSASNSILANSKTASRLAQQGEAAGAVQTAANTVMNPGSIFGTIANSAIGQHLRGLSEQQVNALAPLLIAQGADLQTVITQLQDFAAKKAARGKLLPRTAAQAAGAASVKP